MKNKLKIAALVVAVVTGMVVYKSVFDAREEKRIKQQKSN
jgi:hypothetical protein